MTWTRDETTGRMDDGTGYRYDASTPPDRITEAFRTLDIEQETPVGFYAETVPHDAHTNVPRTWVLVTSRGLYYVDHYSCLCVRAMSVHPYPTEV